MSEQKHTPEQLFLLDGARFKLSFNSIHCDECGAENDRVTVDPLGMYGNELHGKWVALVPAENDRHLKLANRITDLRAELAAAKTQLDNLVVASEKALSECCDLVSTPAGNALQDAIDEAKAHAFGGVPRDRTDIEWRWIGPHPALIWRHVDIPGADLDGRLVRPDEDKGGA